MKCFVINTRSRQLEVYTASVTRMEKDSWGCPMIVVRKAAELGSLSDLIDQNGRVDTDLPVLVIAGGYEARSSAGFVKVYPEFPRRQVYTVGGCGFEFSVLTEEGEMRKVGAALRPWKPQRGFLLEASRVSIRKVATHGNSNVATRDAALAGLEILAHGHDRVVIAEG